MPIPVLSGVGDALDWYQRNIGDTVSGTILKGGNRLKQAAGLGDEGSSIIDQLNPQQAMDFAYQDNPFGRFLMSTATDPLNLVGFGLPEKLAATGAAKAIPGAVHMLEGAQGAEDLIGHGAGAAMDAAGSLLHNTVTPLAGRAAPYLEQVGRAHPGLGENWGQTIRMWKELSHDIPGYHLRNMADDASLMSANGEGQSALDSLSAFPSAVGSTFGHGDVDMKAASDWMNVFSPGGEIPHAITDTGVASSGNNSAFRKFQSSHDTFDPATGEWNKAYDVNSPKDWLIDKLSGFGEFNKRMEQNQELATRGPLWGNAAQSALEPYASDMAGRIHNSGYPDLASEFSDLRGMMNPSELTDRLLAAGHTPADATSVGESWRNAVGEAEGMASDRTNQVLYNYGASPIKDSVAKWETSTGYDAQALGLDPRTSSGDDVFRSTGDRQAAADWDRSLHMARGEQTLRTLAQNTFGGYKFATQNVPAMARLSVEHPVIANAPAQYYRDSDYYNAVHGLPASFHGAMPLPFRNPLNGDQIFVNPASMSSMADLVGSATDHTNDHNQSAIGSLADSLGEIGLGLNPMLKLGLTATGQMGDQQVGDIIRPLTLASGATGLISHEPVNLEQPLKNAVGGVEQALTGKETFPYTDYLLRKRQVELGGGGTPMDATQTDGPLHDAASEDVAHRIAAQDLLRGLGLPDIQFQPHEAESINRNAALERMLQAHNLGFAARGNPTENAYELIDPLKERVQNFNALTPIEQQRLLQDPIALEMLQQQRSKQLHGDLTLAWR